MISNVPVIEINRDNFNIFWPSVLLTVRNSTFLAVDVELSGLGDRKTLNAKSVDDRYKTVAAAAASRSILSLGLSCFTEMFESSSNNSTTHAFKCQTYNFLTLCDDDFVVEPGSVKFLIDHGFDFNLQYAKGLPYRRGSRKQNADDKLTLRRLVKEILDLRKPVVFHNGLVDLIFLYGNFVADLPPSLQTFVADVAELFPAGVYDTKFVADFCARYPASYLEYLFRKCQRGNEADAAAGRPCVDIQLQQFASNVERWIEWAACSIPASREVQVETLCTIFAAHGWCPQGSRCHNSHDVDAVLDLEESKLEKKRAKKRQRRVGPKKRDDIEDSMDIGTSGVDLVLVESNGHVDQGQPNSNEEYSEITALKEDETGKPNQVPKSLPLYTGAHRAGYDAFMTGFSMAYMTLKLDQWPGRNENFDVALYKNKIALSGKDYPLFVQRSSFVKLSHHVAEFLKI